jgi:hypothetical protein
VGLRAGQPCRPRGWAVAVRGRPRAGAGGWSGCSRPGRESSRCCPGARLGRRRRLRRADHRGPVRRRPLLAAGHRRPGAARPGRAGVGAHGFAVPHPLSRASRWRRGRSGSARTAPATSSSCCCRARPSPPPTATWPPAWSTRRPPTRPDRSPSTWSRSSWPPPPGSTSPWPLTCSRGRRRPRRWPGAGAVARSGSAPTAGPRRPTRWRSSASWAGRSRRARWCCRPRRPGPPPRPGPGRPGHRGLVLRHLAGDPGDQRRQPHPGPQRPGS